MIKLLFLDPNEIRFGSKIAISFFNLFNSIDFIWKVVNFREYLNQVVDLNESFLAIKMVSMQRYIYDHTGRTIFPFPFTSNGI